MSKRPSVPVPIRVDAALEAKIEEAARLTGMAKSDVMRLAMRIGFEDLRRINYDVPAAVVDAAKPDLATPAAGPVKYPALRPMKPARVAEDEGNNHAGA